MKSLDAPAAHQARELLTLQCGQMSDLLRGLADAKERIAEEIHAIRKLGKSLRGGFAVFGLEKKAAREIQAVGRLLAAPRDAVSRFKTWQQLEWSHDPAAVAAIHGLLEQQTHSAARLPPAEVIEWCLERVEIARARLDELDAAEADERCVAGLQRLHKRLLKRLRRMRRAEVEDFHETRKALKAWLGAVSIVPGAAGESAGECMDALLGLADCLGDENDLSTLGEWLGTYGFTQRMLPDLWDALDEKRRKLRDRSIDESRRLRKQLLDAAKA
ncbi:MAG: CHAD domain-containing protein [Luteolibacter sp.]